MNEAVAEVALRRGGHGYYWNALRLLKSVSYARLFDGEGKRVNSLIDSLLFMDTVVRIYWGFGRCQFLHWILTSSPMSPMSHALHHQRHFQISPICDVLPYRRAFPNGANLRTCLLALLSTLCIPNAAYWAGIILAGEVRFLTQRQSDPYSCPIQGDGPETNRSIVCRHELSPYPYLESLGQIMLIFSRAYRDFPSASRKCSHCHSTRISSALSFGSKREAAQEGIHDVCEFSFVTMVHSSLSR